MALDMKLVKAIRNDHYDAWMKARNPRHGGGREGDLEPFTDDPQLRYVTADDWKSVLCWTVGALNEPSVLVRFEFSRIRTGWGFGYGHPPYQLPVEEFRTPVYTVSQVYETTDDFMTTAADLKRRANDGKFMNTTLVFDATASGVTVESQLWTLHGFKRIVPLRIIGNDGLKESGFHSIVSRSAMIHDLKHVFDQSRVRIHDDKRMDKLIRQLSSMRAERTPQGYYRTVDDRTNEGLVNQLMTLATGFSVIEAETAVGEVRLYV